jgi:protoporphyrinogen oxidase
MKTETLIVGAGMSGLATAAALTKSKDLLVIDRDGEIGGYCKTIKKDGFVWDYSGHFFHFKHPDIEQWLLERMPGQNIRKVQKQSFINYRGQRIDFPFQKNIHQLEKSEFIDCLSDLYFAHLEAQSNPHAKPANFLEMLYARFGKGIAERFLVPYNEKLYATELSRLDVNAMGRFFPHADLTDIIRNMKHADNSSYNAAFTYPEGGAIEYVNAVASEVDHLKIGLNETLLQVDLKKKVAVTNRREIQFERLVSSIPFPKLLSCCGIEFDAREYSYNQVLVFNFGFDSKGDEVAHWVYFPDRALQFYRVGYYDNIFGADRMSLYVEVGFPSHTQVDIAKTRETVLADLKKAGIVTSQRLVAEHAVLMSPAYVHITERSIEEVARLRGELEAAQVFSIGRYGGWTYCSIEDNIVEARALVKRLNR